METLGRAMRRAPRRILGQFGGENAGGQAYHVMSRTAGGEKLFGDTEKEAFRRLMWRMARFSGVEVLTYALMANHFHILVKVPERARFLKRFEGEGGEERLLEHLSLLYSKSYIAAVRQELARVRAAGREGEVEVILEAFRKRFCDLSAFVKELKERFSRWYNKQHERRGTLWMERFKSVLVEDGEALRTMALYIDLNPVRAGLVEDPKDYRWTGYGEATGGSKRARRGLCKVMEAPLDSWEERLGEPPTSSSPSAKASRDWQLRGPGTPAEAYRCWLFGEGLETAVEKGIGSGAAESAEWSGLEVSGRLPTSPRLRGPGKSALPSNKKGFSKEKVEAVLKGGGKLARAELLRCRVRWFSDGVAIGSKGFVEGVFSRCRGHFGAKKKTGARPVREDSAGTLHALRELRPRCCRYSSTILPSGWCSVQVGSGGQAAFEPW
jgi:REP element-mobilizing transposase RayT